MKVLRLVLRLIAAAACVALGFGLSQVSHRWGDPLEPASGRAVLQTTGMTRARVERGTQSSGDDDTFQNLSSKEHAAILRSARRQMYLELLQDPASQIRQTGWFTKLNGEKGLDYVVDTLVRATRIETIPDTNEVVVNVSIWPPGDAATIVNTFCEKYIDQRKASQFERAGQLIAMVEKQKGLLDLELNEDVLKKLSELELQLSFAGINTYSDQSDTKAIAQELSREMVQAMVEQTEASEVFNGLNEGDSYTSDAGRQRLASANHHLASLRSTRAALREESANDQALMDRYTTLKQRESLLRQRLQAAADQLSYLREFELNRRRADVDFAAMAYPNRF